ncbi:MAG: HAMP domain-containing sensor histidine kinase [bacterium]|nr:HAMP domain-containing sensor histidine kinase [bacterium]
MKSSLLGYLPCALAAVGLVAFGFVLKTETDGYRLAVETWAERDLAARTQLAAESIQDALVTGDFAHLRDFADARRADGLRLTVLTSPGGMVYDSEPTASGNHGDCPEVKSARITGTGSAIRKSRTTNQRMLFCARQAGNDFIVRLALPYETVVEPLRRNRPALILSGLFGASGILLILLFSFRLVARNRELARERDAQERLLKEMERVADFRRDFIANVSHEIKTPLTGILGATEILSSSDANALPEDDRRELLGMLRRESTRLDALARDILSLSRLERGEEERRQDFQPADLADILTSAANLVRPQAQAAGIRLIVHPAESVIVPCDARLVEQALVNLALNAVRHSGSPDVELSLAATENGASFTVVDHGIGLHEADRVRVFERFFRVDKARSRDQGGTGLGLAIVKHVAQIHHGDATVVSEPGHGCAFTLTINKPRKENEHED